VFSVRVVTANNGADLAHIDVCANERKRHAYLGMGAVLGVRAVHDARYDFSGDWENNHGQVKGDTMILRCTCQNTGQDKLHGGGNRVHNAIVANPSEYRCTVCRRERNKSGSIRRAAKQLEANKC
jgi:hypothetical protein